MTIDYVNKIIVPYVKANKCQELGFTDEQSAVVLFDVFKGQYVKSVFKILEDNNILYVIVPANCTNKLQPLDYPRPCGWRVQYFICLFVCVCVCVC